MGARTQGTPVALGIQTWFLSLMDNPVFMVLVKGMALEEANQGRQQKGENGMGDAKENGRENINSLVFMTSSWKICCITRGFWMHGE